ncbi:single-stranded DNA-binding protein [Nocardia terpenica]|uniref:Single-stranded DNA-binding protein n=1 Tax=Nocardia terpenica TaxID=455432 RepID=A0A291RJD7_9NOCA|nr:single-stranded DNA-binding protein [Nocardia terpenica]ATL67408.1 single-stranded DNA-binding protein [Nocardia terpenica]
MAGELFVTVIGNLTQDLELRKTPTGNRVTTATIAQNPRFVDRATGEWKDGDAVFMRANIWDDMAEHAVATLAKGMRVIAYGQLKQRSWETADGERRWATELLVSSIGPDLRYATAAVTKVERNAVEPHRSTPADEEPEPASTSARDKVPF